VPVLHQQFPQYPYLTLHPGIGRSAPLGGSHKPAMASGCHGFYAPPRFSPSRPHCVFPHPRAGL